VSIFKRLASLFNPKTSYDERNYWIYVVCDRCGEKIRARLDLLNDLSVEYGTSEADNRYHCRKVLIGEQRCYQPIEVELNFDHRRKLLDQNIKGGKFITADEFVAG
jgi:hypothetical protein